MLDWTMGPPLIAHSFTSVEEYYRKDFLEACDLLVVELDRRFDQVKMKPVIAVEKLLVQASNSLDFYKSLQVLQASCFCNNFDFFRLTHQLHMVNDLVKTALPDVCQVTSLQTLCDAFNLSQLTSA